MTDADRAAFAQIMARLWITFGQPEDRRLAAEAYFDALLELDLVDVDAAARDLCRTHEWMPRPAHLIERARELRLGRINGLADTRGLTQGPPCTWEQHQAAMAVLKRVPDELTPEAANAEIQRILGGDGVRA